MTISTERAKKLHALRRTLLDFGVRDRKLRVSYYTQRHRFYRSCCEAFELDRFYVEVKDQVSELYGDLLLDQQRSTELRTRQLEHRLGLLAALFGISALVLVVLGINLRGITSEFGLKLGIAVALFLAGWTVGATLLLVMLKRDRGTRDSRRAGD